MHQSLDQEIGFRNPLTQGYVLKQELRHEKTNIIAYAKTKAQISFAVTAKLISAFVSTTQILQFILYLSKNFKILAFVCGSVGV